MEIAKDKVQESQTGFDFRTELKRRLGFAILCLVIAALVSFPTDMPSCAYLAGLVTVAIIAYSAERWGKSKTSENFCSSESSSDHMQSLVIAGFVCTLVNVAVQVGEWRSQYALLCPAIATWYCIVLAFVSPMPMSPIKTVFARLGYKHRVLVIVCTTIASVWEHRYGMLVPAFFMLIDLTSPVEVGNDKAHWIDNGITALVIACCAGLTLHP